MPPEKLFIIVWATGIVLIWPPMFWWVIRSRRAQGHQIIPQTPSDATYAEKRASGREPGKLGGASNCLLVTVTPDEFLVTPTFPFNMIAPPRGPIGLVHKVARRHVRATSDRSWPSNVRVAIETASYSTVLYLKLAKPDLFLAALGEQPSVAGPRLQ